MVGALAVWAKAVPGIASMAHTRRARAQANGMGRWVEGKLLTHMTDERVGVVVTPFVILTGRARMLCVGSHLRAFGSLSRDRLKVT